MGLKKNGGRSEQCRKNFAMSAFVYSFWNQNNENFMNVFTKLFSFQIDKS